MTITNDDLARVFHEIGDILEVKGEIPFKTIAYHRAADAIARAPFDVASTYAGGDRRAIPGVGQAIGDKIVEMAATGHIALLRPARARRSRRASLTCSGSRASGRRPFAWSGRISGSTAWRTCGAPPRRAVSGG